MLHDARDHGYRFPPQRTVVGRHAMFRQGSRHSLGNGCSGGFQQVNARGRPYVYGHLEVAGVFDIQVDG